MPDNTQAIRQSFKAEFETAVALLMDNYGKCEEKAREIVGIIICNVLQRLQIDADSMVFLDFYKKHIHNAPWLFENKDFTVSQITELIDETSFTPEDKEMAFKMFAENKTQSKIADECGLYDARTVANNRERLSEALKKTASKLYK